MSFLEEIKKLNNLAKVSTFFINEKNNLAEKIKKEAAVEFKKIFNFNNNIRIDYYFDLNTSEMSISEDLILPKIRVRKFLDNLDDAIYIILENSFIWYKHSNFNGDVYPLHIIKNKDPLFTLDEYLQIVKSFEDRFKIEVDTSTYFLKTTVEYILNFSDLKIIHPYAELLGNGKIWYKGWDIPDIWYLIKNNDEILFYYSDDAHSECMTKFISGKENIVEFIKKYDIDVQKEILNIL
jgi:hypothetical protein